MAYPDTDYLTKLTIKRLAELNATRAKVEALEARAMLLEDYEVERKKLAVLQRLQEQHGALAPALADANAAVRELKSHLQSVYDADLLLDPELRALTALHAVAYATRTLDRMSEPGRYSMEGSAGVLELASSTLAMFSSRPGAGAAFAEAGTAPVLIKLLSPLFPPVVVINICNNVGNMADDYDFRQALRTGGGVGALVRLLRGDCETAVQAASAGALSLLSARDIVIQDSVRYLGGIDLLVDMMVTGDTYTAETARYCLLSLRHGNVRNQADIIASIRANPGLVKNVRRLDLASELLRFEEGTPRVRPSYATTPLRDYGTPTKTSLRPKTADSFRHKAADYYVQPLTSARSPAARYQPPGLGASAAASAAAARVLALTSPRLAATSLRLLASPSKYTPPASVSPGLEAAYELGAMPEIDSALLKRKHLMRYTPEDLATLLQETGFDKLDLRGFRLHRVSGLDLLDMTEDEMLVRLMLPRHKVRKLRALQHAVALYDRIATLPRQGSLSEVEMRLYLASHGCGIAEVDKVVRLFRSLVRTDALDFVTFWDFVTGYDWISQALRIYNVPS